MELIAIVILFWQRRRVTAAVRRGWGWTRRTAAEVPSGSRRGRTAGVAREAARRGWKAIDTDENAKRVAGVVSWLRRFATSDTVARREQAV